MKVLTAAQMRAVDRRTIESGIPGLVLMENAGSRVLDCMASRFAPLAGQRIVVVCGKGNNGGDGLVIARQLWTRFRPRALDVVLTARAEDLQADAAANLRMLAACGCPWSTAITPAMRQATLVVDALLGTGLRGPATGTAAAWIAEINHGFPLAKVVAVDLPSGMSSDDACSEGPVARADLTVTFTAPKLCHALPPNCDRIGDLCVVPIGTPPRMYEEDDTITLWLVEPAWFAPLFRPRPRGAHKGSFGHVLVAGGSRSKPGAAAMAGLAALRAGAGLVTVASAASAIAAITAHAAELMAEPLPETPSGAVAGLGDALQGKDVLAIGPGLGTEPETVDWVRSLFHTCPLPVVIDADGLNALAGTDFRGGAALRVLTPHPGEMSRLTGQPVPAIQADRIAAARSLAAARAVVVVLKGQRTLIAFPGGAVWINPTGTPALATAGTGDILTGLIAGLMAQFPQDASLAVAAAVWLHGRCGELGRQRWGEKCLLATDLLSFLPEAMNELAVPD